MKLYRMFALFTTLILLASSVGAMPAAARPATSAVSALVSTSVRIIKPGASVVPGSGSYTKWTPGTGYTAEFPKGDLGGKAPTKGGASLGANRSLSYGNTGPSITGVASSPQVTVVDPKLKKSFEGLNFFEQRWAAGGNQWSVEPPDQGLCASSNYVIETTNDVVNVFDAHTGQSVLPANDVGGAVDLNSFYGYPVAIDRTNFIFGPSLTDPSCVYDAASGRFFVIVLTFDIDPANGNYTLGNHIDLAVSTSSNPLDKWNVYQLVVTMDGYNPDPNNQCPCLGDYPHLGLDANGVYISTNSYPWMGNGFDGAQLYAIQKSDVIRGTNATVVNYNTWNMVNAPSDAGNKQPGFTVWPAQSPDGVYNNANGGTEYFVSSNAADEATHPVAGTGGTYTSNKLVVWTLKNTSALNGPHPMDAQLSSRLISVGKYSLPPTAKQPGTGKSPTTSSPLGYCTNDTKTELNPLYFGPGAKGCWQVLGDSGPELIKEAIPYLDSNDTRIQQVTYAGGTLWTTLDTALTPGGVKTRAGIEWFQIKPDQVVAIKQGYLGAVGMDFTYPSVGMTQTGKGIISFTATGDAAFPGAAYAPVDGTNGVTGWSYAKTGAAPDDGFSGYWDTNGAKPRPRWGDYGATAVVGGNIWMASEYIAAACDYNTWGGAYFEHGTTDPGICNGTRAFYGNWSTRVSQYQP